MNAYSPPHHEPSGVFGELGLDRRPSELIDAVKAGLPVHTFQAVANALQVPEGALARLAGISATTLTRRKRAGALQPDEGERVLRFARLLDRATGVFGEAQDAADWLKSPNPALGHVPPLEYADTEIGAREVEHLIGRIEYGVYS